MPTAPKPPEPQGPKPDPIKAPKGKPTPMQPSNSKYDFLLNSPFAKMFKATGAMPTVKEIRAIINGILKQQLNEMKRQDAGWKKAMRKLKDAIEGKG